MGNVAHKKEALIAGGIFTGIAVLVLIVLLGIFPVGIMLVFIWAAPPAVFVMASTIWWWLILKNHQSSPNRGILTGFLIALSSYYLMFVIWGVSVLLISEAVPGESDVVDALFSIFLSPLFFMLVGLSMAWPIFPVAMLVGYLLVKRRGAGKLI